MKYLKAYSEETALPTHDAIAPLAKDSARRPEFIQAVADFGVWLLMKDLGEEDEDHREGESSFFDYYSDDGMLIFPVFSSHFAAETYWQHVFKDNGSMRAYVTNQEASWLVKNSFPRARLVLNPKSASETELTLQDLENLREILRTKLR